MRDKLLICVQCGDRFLLSAEDQDRLMAHGFDAPKRCPDCRKRKYRCFQEENEEWGKTRKRKHSRKGRMRFDEDDE